MFLCYIGLGPSLTLTLCAGKYLLKCTSFMQQLSTMNEMNESAMILSAFENRLRAGLV